MVSGDPAQLQEVISFAEERAKPVIESLPGSRGASVFADRPRGRVVVVSAWETEQAMHASDQRLRPLRDEAASLVAGRWRADDYEIAVFEQPDAVPPGCWLRTTALSVEPSRVRDTIAWFQRTLVRGLRHTDGFRAAMLMVDRGTGSAIGSTLWSSRDALQATAGVAIGLRQAVTAATGGRITGVAEWEVVAADVRPPRYEHLFRRAYEAMSAGGDLDDLDRLVAEDLVEHAALPPDVPPGRAGLKTLMARYRDAVPDLSITLEKYVEEGDVGCSVLRLTGTHTGTLMGIPPTGRRFDIAGTDVVRVVDGVAVEHWGSSDDLGMLVQLGVLDLPSAVPQQPTSVDLTDQAATEQLTR